MFSHGRANKNIVLATSLHGGHLAFFEGITGSRLWYFILFIRTIYFLVEFFIASELLHILIDDNHEIATKKSYSFLQCFCQKHHMIQCCLDAFHCRHYFTKLPPFLEQLDLSSLMGHCA